MIRIGAILAFCLTAGACAGAGDDADMAYYKAEAIGSSPLQREISSAVTFYSCGPHPQPDRYTALCEVCNVDIYPDKGLAFNEDPDTEAPVIGIKGWATHFYHEFKPWGDDPRPRISSTGERASEKFEASSVSIRAINVMFDSANAWCRERGDGELIILKHDPEAYIEGQQS